MEYCLSLEDKEDDLNTSSLIKLVPLTTNDDKSEILGPIKILWARVILRAMYDYVILKDSTKLKDKREFHSVKKWLFEPSNLGNGLENLCKFLGWPTNLIRQRALSMTRDDVKKMEFRDRDNNHLKALSNGKAS